MKTRTFKTGKTADDFILQHGIRYAEKHDVPVQAATEVILKAIRGNQASMSEFRKVYADREASVKQWAIAADRMGQAIAEQVDQIIENTLRGLR